MAKYAQNGLRMHFLQSRISKFSVPPAYQRGGIPPLGLSPTCACGAQFVPMALNSPPTL